MNTDRNDIAREAFRLSPKVERGIVAERRAVQKFKAPVNPVQHSLLANPGGLFASH